jgi:hypothetical protein
VIAIGLIRGILGMLGLFYNNSGEGSKQPVNLRSFPDLGDTVPDPTPIMSRTNDT